MKAAEHFRTITEHKKLVGRYCFAVGLYKQGLLHDVSKYSPTEFLVGAKYFQGDRSPNNAEREKKGYSSAWLHHKGRNKHHFEYWIDYGKGGEGTVLVGMKMPVRYVVEMFIDRIAACRIYQKEKYTDASPQIYYEKGIKFHIMHPESQALLEKLLYMLASDGEEKTLRYVSRIIREDKIIRLKNICRSFFVKK